METVYIGKKRRIDAKAFLAMTSAVFNIASNKTGDSKEKVRYDKSVLRAAKKLLRTAGRDPNKLAGARDAARLFLEVTAVSDMEDYMTRQSKAAILGERQEFEGADVVVTVTSVRHGIKLIEKP